MNASIVLYAPTDGISATESFSTLYHRTRMGTHVPRDLSCDARSPVFARIPVYTTHRNTSTAPCGAAGDV